MRWSSTSAAFEVVVNTPGTISARNGVPWPGRVSSAGGVMVQM